MRIPVTLTDAERESIRQRRQAKQRAYDIARKRVRARSRTGKPHTPNGFKPKLGITLFGDKQFTASERQLIDGWIAAAHVLWQAAIRKVRKYDRLSINWNLGHPTIPREWWDELDRADEAVRAGLACWRFAHV